MKPMTEKQMVAINNVEKVLRVKFGGETKQDAFLWLRENMPKAVEKETERLSDYATSESARPNTYIHNHEYLDNFRPVERDGSIAYETIEEQEKELALLKKYLGL
jgi:hypothetical protein